MKRKVKVMVGSSVAYIGACLGAYPDKDLLFYAQLLYIAMLGAFILVPSLHRWCFDPKFNKE